MEIAEGIAEGIPIRIYNQTEPSNPNLCFNHSRVEQVSVNFGVGKF